MAAQRRVQSSLRLSLIVATTTILSLFVVQTILHLRAEAADGIHKQINFQGKLQNSDGTNVSDGSYSVTFTLYDAASSGTNLWDETQTVSTTDGIFRVSLGSVDTTLGSVNFNTDSLYLGIKVGSDSEMTPRVRFTAVPYAFNAQKVNGLTVTNTSDNPFSSTTTLKIGDGKTVVLNNSITLSGTDGKTYTFPAISGSSDTVVTEAFAQTLTNKTIGSTGLTFSGATTDITTGTNEHFSIMPNGTGNVGIGTTSPLSLLDLSSTNPTLRLSDTTSSANDLLLTLDGNKAIFGEAASATLLTLDLANGRVGIGNTSPSYVFDVTGSTRLLGSIFLSGAVTSSTTVALGDNSSADNVSVQTGTGIFSVSNSTLNNLLYIPNGGNIGIGTTSPIGRVNIYGAITGKALTIFDERGDQDIFTASASGSTVFTLNRSGQILLPDGSASLPSFSFASDPDTGMYHHSSANNLSFAVGGSETLRLTSTGRFLLTTAGTEGSPTFTLNSDNDTGFFWPTGNNFAVTTGGTERMRFDNTGNIGIGTTSPFGKLNLYGSATGKALAILDERGDQDIFTASKSGVTKFLIDTNGNIGIGTTNSISKLYVSGGNVAVDAGSRFILDADSGINSYLTHSSNSIRIISDNTEVAAFRNSGNVGIGTTDPVSRLHLYGAVTGKALSIYDERGDQDIFTASASGVTKFTVDRSGRLFLSQATAPSTTTNMLYNVSGNLYWNGTQLGSGGSSQWTTVNTNEIYYNSGNVGIGTSDPAALLHVEGSGHVYQFFKRTDNNYNIAQYFAPAGTITSSNVQWLTGMQAGSNSYQIYNWDGTQTNEPFTIKNDGNVGIGTTNPTSALHISKNMSAGRLITAEGIFSSTTSQVGINSIPTISPSSASTDYYYGVVGSPVSNSSNISGAGVLGFYASPYIYGSASVNELMGSFYESVNDGTGTIASSYGVRIRNKNTGGGTLTQSYGTYIHNPTNTGVGSTITNNSALYIEAQTSGTNNVGIVIGEATGTKNTNLLIGTTTQPSGSWSIYNSSTDANYFAGNIGIGTTTISSTLAIVNSGDVEALNITAPDINTQAAFTLSAPLSTGPNDGKAFQVKVPGESFGRVMFYTDGKFGIGGGSATRDIFLSRPSTNTLRISGNGSSSTGNLQITGNLGVGTTSPIGKLQLYGSATGKALAILDERGDQDIFTASASGTTVFTLDRTGRLYLADSSAPSPTTNRLYAVAGNLYWNGTQLGSGGSSQWTTVNTNEIYYNSGNVGIGTSDPGAPLHIVGNAPDTGNGAAFEFAPTLTSALNNQNGLRVSTVVNVSGNVDKTFTGIAGNISSSESGTDLDDAVLIGLRGYAYISGAGSYANVQGGNYTIELDAAGTISNGYGLVINDAAKSAGNINQLYGLAVTGQTKGTNHNVTGALGLASGATNNINLLLGQSTLPTGNWSLYNGSSYANYFAGNVGIGTTNTSSGKLEVAGALFVGDGGGGLDDRIVSRYNNQNTIEFAGAGGLVQTSYLSAAYQLDNDNNDTTEAFEIRTDGNSRLLLNVSASGNVGIGMNDPGEKLEIDGAIELRTMTAPGCLSGEYKIYADSSGSILKKCQNGTVSDLDTTSSSGSYSPFQQTSGTVQLVNNTVDFLLGGTATSSARYSFGMHGATPMATFAANLKLDSRPNSSVTEQTTWTKVSQSTAGTIAASGTSGIASVSASVVYNGSLYIGTYKDDTGTAEVYRFDNGGANWTKVSQSTAGTIAASGTTGIASVSAMTVFDGRLYIGTSKMNSAEVYRYEGGTTWTKVTSGTAGTIGSVTAQDGIASLAVYQGRMYAGTRELTGARLMRYDGGINGWTAVNTTAGTFVATNTVAVDAITAMVVKNGFLYLGTARGGDADVLRYAGGQGATNAFFMSMNAAGTTGSYNINGTATTGVNEITAMTVYNGAVVVAIRRAGGQADVISLNDGMPSGTTSPDSWTRLNPTSGTMSNGGTTAIDAVTAMTVYNGQLIIGTNEPNSTEIYRYTGGDQRFLKISQSTAGTIASGGTASIDQITFLQPSNGDLYTGTFEGGKAEIYKHTSNIDRSYSLEFHANPQIAGGEQNNIQNHASIYFVASASANLGSAAGNTGAMVFSHGIQTRNGSYDVAEDYPTRDDSLEPGDLVSIDVNERGFVKKSESSYESTLIGIYSEKPALRLTQMDDTIDGGRVIPVALAGRVPVKVSTENGVIKPGDYLTSSSVPGVAMKATKAGGVVGQAMQGYDGEGVGRVMTYVKSASYNGTVASHFAQINTASDEASLTILSSLLAGEKSKGSEIVTDAVVAGLEVVTPKVIAHTVQLDKISSATGNNVSLQLKKDGKFIVMNEEGKEGIVFDSEGNVTFAGTVTAKRIKAEQIDGLEIIAGKLTLLSDKVASVSSLFATAPVQEVAGSAISSGIIEVDEKEIASIPSISSHILTTEGFATVSGTLRVQKDGLFEGMLSVIDTLTTRDLLVMKTSTFFGKVFFKDDIEVGGKIHVNKDTAGVALVEKGKKKVEVVFEKPFEVKPVVSVTFTSENISDDVFAKAVEDGVCEQSSSKEACEEKLSEKILEQNVRYLVIRQSEKGFTILLDKNAPETVYFNWTAFGEKDSVISNKSSP